MLTKLYKYGLALGSFMLIEASALAGENDIGKKLHESNCVKCHDTSVYTRKNKQTSSLAALKTRVSGCYKVAGANWTDKQLDSVVDYLNTSFYKFSK